MNTAPTGGAISAWGHQAGTLTIKNNLVINNTGEGIFAYSKWKSDKDQPQFIIENNTILFSWKHDSIASYGGNALKIDAEIRLTASNNVFAFSDYGGVDRNLSTTLRITEREFTVQRLLSFVGK